MPITDTNPVGTLQEHAQSKGGMFPQYKLLQAVGESHSPHFTIEVKFGELTAEGSATTKKQAKHEAARNMLAIMRGEKKSSNLKHSDMEEAANEEKNDNETSEDKVKTDDKATPDQKVYTGNKIGELQEFCMSRGIGLPAYTDGETTGPSHMRHFTIVCAVGKVERVGAGGTKKEAKRQAAGAVLEGILFAGEKNEDAEESGQIETKDITTTNNNEIENGRKDEVSAESKIVDQDVLNKKIEELNRDVLEDQDSENTPEDIDE